MITVIVDALKNLITAIEYSGFAIVEHKFLAIRLQETHQLDMAMSCKILCISRTAYYNQPNLTDDKNLDTLTRHKAISAT